MSIRPLHERGTFLWGFIHTITVIDISDADIQKRIVDRVFTMLNQLPQLISCRRCQEHFQGYLQMISTKDYVKPMALFYFMVDFHNEVNQKLEKPIMSHEDALARWTKTIQPGVDVDPLAAFIRSASQGAHGSHPLTPLSHPPEPSRLPLVPSLPQ